MKRILKSLLALAFLSPILASALGTEADARGRWGHCQSAVDAEIDRLAINRADIAGITFDRKTQSSGDGDNRTVGINAWVKLNSCKGSIVVDMRTNCKVRQVYTRGECRVDGIKGF
jgi:hypothetical protein